MAGGTEGASGLRKRLECQSAGIAVELSFTLSALGRYQIVLSITFPPKTEYRLLLLSSTTNLAEILYSSSASFSSLP